jgi:hypothetical protein
MILNLPQGSLENEPEPLGDVNAVNIVLEPIARLEGVRLQLHGVAYASIEIDHIAQIAVVAEICHRVGWALYDRRLGELVRLT